MPYKEFRIDGIGTVKVYRRKGNRSMRLTVSGDGNVRVSLPMWAPYQAGVAFAASRQGWITKQTQRIPDIVLVHGQQIGKAHHLRFQPSPIADVAKATVRGTTIITTYHPRQQTNDPTVQAVARAACLRALRIQAGELLGRRLQQLADLHDVAYEGLSIKRMKTRWGSCDQRRHIVLNLFLIQLPWECIDYVILHELAHTKALNHGPTFWKTLEGWLPNARSLRKAMRAYQPTLLVAEPQPYVA
jgi:predicted metal-dependent hydrolase